VAICWSAGVLTRSCINFHIVCLAVRSGRAGVALKELLHEHLEKSECEVIEDIAELDRGR
jgi:hypothetical protein